MRIAGKLVLVVLAAVGSALAADPLPVADTSVAGTIYVATLDNGFNIRFDHRQVSQDTSRLYLTAAEDGFLDVPTAQITSIEQEKLPPAPVTQPAKVDVRSAIAASNKHELDPDLIDSVIQAESGFNARAVSPKGAQGLMQLMPDTAAKLGVPDAFNPQANVDGGSRYLRELLARFNNDLVKALAAYNAGPHRVEQYRGVPPYRETRAYVSRIIRDFNRKKLAQMPPQQARAAAPSKAGQRQQTTGE